jgi:hypothetical protein
LFLVIKKVIDMLDLRLIELIVANILVLIINKILFDYIREKKCTAKK